MTETIKLLWGYQAPKAFYEDVAKQVALAMGSIEAGKLYTTKTLCGDAFWSGLGRNKNKRLAGRCLAHMVYKKRFPFEFVQHMRSPTKRYRLR